MGTDEMINVRTLARAVRAPLRIRNVPHVKPPAPTKEDLERKFVMRTDKKGNPYIKEV